jgi:8-oxo-dGTP pyrophosphatase MutT (NUDIX family)
MTAKTIIRGRACAIIRQADRILLNRFGGDSFWALPGGAVEQGEFSSDALLDFRPRVLRLPLLAHVSGAESAAPLHFLHRD